MNLVARFRGNIIEQNLNRLILMTFQAMTTYIQVQNKERNYCRKKSHFLVLQLGLFGLDSELNSGGSVILDTLNL